MQLNWKKTKSYYFKIFIFSITGNICEHSRKLDALIEMVAKNTENIEIIKSMLRRKVDIEEFEALEKRVMILEKKLLSSM